MQRSTGPFKNLVEQETLVPAMSIVTCNDEGIYQKHVHGYLTGQPRAERLGDIAKELVVEAKNMILLTTRPVTAALAGAVMANETAYPGTLDVVGYNDTEYRYKEDHQKYPDRIFYGNERI